MQDIQAAIQHAAKGGKVGIVGYCWGGLLSWRSACTLDGLSAAVTYYGGGMTTPDESRAKHPKVPVLSHFGDQDHWIPLDSVEAFKKSHPEVEVHVYQANHGFNCDQRGSWDAPSAQAGARALAGVLRQAPRHILADGGLRHVEPLGCLGKAAVRGDFPEGSDQIETVHVNEPIVSVLGTRWFDSPGFFLTGSSDTSVTRRRRQPGWAVGRN
jgi:hypothetical protein